MASPTVSPRRGTGLVPFSAAVRGWDRASSLQLVIQWAAFLTARGGEGQGPFYLYPCCLVVDEWQGQLSHTAPRHAHGPRSATAPCSLVAIQALGINTKPCLCIAMNPDIALSGRSGGDFTIAPGGGTGTSSVLSLFMTLKLLHFSFCLISPHTHTLWWLLQQADIMAGGRLGDIILLCCKQGRIYGLPVLCVGG